MTTTEITDGTLQGWPCSAEITGDSVTGYDLQTAAYTNEDEESASFEIGQAIEACQGSFKTKKQARDFAVKCCFVPDSKWGEMNL